MVDILGVTEEPKGLKLAGWPKIEEMDEVGVKVVAVGLSAVPNVDVDVGPPNGLVSGMNRLFSSSWESPASGLDSSDSIKPSRMALATDTPLMTAVRDRRNLFFST